jgi:hypothetical protein
MGLADGTNRIVFSQQVSPFGEEQIPSWDVPYDKGARMFLFLPTPCLLGGVGE